MSEPDPELLVTKAKLRETALQQRELIPPPQRSAAAETIAARGLPVPLSGADIVSGFMPIRSEINPLPLLRRCAEAGAALALPVVQGRGKPLAMRAWTFGGPLVRGQWGIREPGPEAPEVLPSIALVPLAAFDRRGYRIGYGAGYYDMTLARLRAARRIVAVGIAYAAQEIERVPNLAHDQPLDFVLTEREIVECRRS